MQIPIIDVFAGPGGLGEGFSRVGASEKKPYFQIAVSVEKDVYAHSTLELRGFFRHLARSEDSSLENYYKFVRGEMSRDELFENHPQQARSARSEAWHAALGSGEEFDNELDRRIERVTPDNGKWVLIGGPPCQAYSIIGRAKRSSFEGYKPEDDERNFLYIEYLRIIAKHRPAVFVMENVKGILSASIQGQKIFQQIMSDLRDPSAVFSEFRSTEPCNYRIYSLSTPCDAEGKLRPVDYIVECEKYGIPQARHRVILLGIRQDLVATPALLTKADPVPARAVLMGLPRLRSGLSREPDCPANWKQRLKEGLERRWLSSARKMWGTDLENQLVKALSSGRCPLHDRGGEFIPFVTSVREDLKWWYEDHQLGGVCNHTSRAHMLKDVYRYLYAASYAKTVGGSPRLHQFPPDLLPDHENATSGHFDDRFRVQVYDSPSTTITSHISKDGHYYIHPDPFQCRSLTVREAARLQTFPDNYFFCGNRTQQYTQVGNAVPPLLAYQIAEIVRNVLESS